jgi:hypothetical protein
MSKTQKIFCGSGKQKTDNWMKITVNPDKLMEYVQEYEGNRFVKLDINLLPAPNQYGKDIEVTIDTWQPTKSKDKVEVVPDTNNDDLPF